jgi:hypothetical protein
VAAHWGAPPGFWHPPGLTPLAAACLVIIMIGATVITTVRRWASGWR